MAEDNCTWIVGTSCNATEHMGVSSTYFEEPSGLELVHGTQETGRRQQAPAPRSKDRRGCDGEDEDEEEDGDENEGARGRHCRRFQRTARA